ncbi:MAG: PQQ-binding-like beta-propeller repeat protein [Chitinophagaceae bacterium]|nr:PQQ-binding-like beta-propeller repeat protein [Chitinophagaceae bacterium]
MFHKPVNAFYAFCLLIFSCNSTEPDGWKEWRMVNGNTSSNKYTSLSQIDSTNVQQLQAAWTYRTGDADTSNRSQIQCNPIVVDGILYATSPALKLFALDAATGKEKWLFDPKDSAANKVSTPFGAALNRGVTYWQEDEDKRIFYAAGAWLFCVDAASGKLIASFGSNGAVNLREGLGRDVANYELSANSPGIIYKDLLIIGARLSEGLPAAPGHIRAFDVRTGKQRWMFHTIPHPGEPGYETWEDPEAYKFIGGVNCWAGFSLDQQRGIVYAPLGSASFDFYGGNRKGANLYANCLLALDAATGKHIWHFQTIHHDLWDRDLPTPPTLVTVTRNGKKVDAVAQPTKAGYIYVLDRETGTPLFPVEEMPVPVDSDLAGEKPWPTQPVPALPEPFARQAFKEFTVDDLNDLVPDSSYQDIKKRFLSYRTGNMYNPPSKQGTLIFPGFDGAAEWGGPAVDPETGIMYVNSNEMPWILTMVDIDHTSSAGETYPEAGRQLYQQNCMSCHGTDRKGSGNFPSIRDAKKKYTGQQFALLLSTGRRMMPSFKQLPPEEVKALTAFVLEDKSLQNKKTTARPSAAIDSNISLPYNSTGYHKFLTKEGYPAVKPPWGTLNAVDLNSGRLLWKSVLGEFPELVQKGIPPTGTENYGGPVVTKSGMLFIAATRDSKFRVFNKASGKLLWETQLPYPGFASPAVYEADGRQFIVIACGGGKLGTKSGDTYMAFALPEAK